MEKETATEWLFKQLWEEPKDKFTWNAILSKAKEMEKEQKIEFAFNFYYDFSNQLGVPFNLISENKLNAEQYYNQTFKSE